MVFENAQDREKTWLVEPGERQMRFEKNEKVPNCGTFVIEKEDHTVGNLVRHQLLTNPSVRFAAYQIPHPLEHRINVRVQTNDATTSPMEALEHAFTDLQKEFDQIHARFTESIKESQKDADDPFAS